jgi:hypothetical protein
MPFVPRRKKERRADYEELTRGQRKQLEDGSCMACLIGFRDVDEMRAAWEVHGADLVAEFIANRPGHRPFGWWVFVHKLERPIVNHHVRDAAIEQSSRRACFGFLHSDIGVPKGDMLLPWQEPEPDYLSRKGLLEPGEFERAKKNSDE